MAGKLRIVFTLLAALLALVSAPAAPAEGPRYSPPTSWTRGMEAQEHGALSAAVEGTLVRGPGPVRLTRVAVVDPAARAGVYLDAVPPETVARLRALGARPDTLRTFESRLMAAAQLGRPLDLSIPSVFADPMRTSREEYFRALERKHPGFGAKITLSRAAFGDEGRQALVWMRLDSGERQADLWVLLGRTEAGWTVTGVL